MTLHWVKGGSGEGCLGGHGNRAVGVCGGTVGVCGGSGCLHYRAGLPGVVSLGVVAAGARVSVGFDIKPGWSLRY